MNVFIEFIGNSRLLAWNQDGLVVMPDVLAMLRTQAHTDRRTLGAAPSVCYMFVARLLAIKNQCVRLNGFSKLNRRNFYFFFIYKYFREYDFELIQSPIRDFHAWRVPPAGG